MRRYAQERALAEQLALAAEVALPAVVFEVSFGFRYPSLPEEELSCASYS